jgi:hypothetical protein
MTVSCKLQFVRLLIKMCNTLERYFDLNLRINQLISISQRLLWFLNDCEWLMDRILEYFYFIGYSKLLIQSKSEQKEVVHTFRDAKHGQRNIFPTRIRQYIKAMAQTKTETQTSITRDKPIKYVCWICLKIRGNTNAYLHMWICTYLV